MNLYAGFLDLDNKQYKLYTIPVEEVSSDTWKANRGLHISFVSTISQISKNYLELMLHIGETNSNKIYIYYSFDKDKIINKMITFANITKEEIKIV